MGKTSSQIAAFTGKGIKLTEFSFLLLIASALFLKLQLIFQIAINQDEFLYLSKIHLYNQGNLTNQFQTFHVHFFSWLSSISENEVTQVIAARSALYLLFLGSCIYTYLVGRQYINRSGALFGVLCYISFSYVVVNGSSFRSDTISTFLFLLSVYHLIDTRRPIISSVIAGLAMALSLMVTIKAFVHLLTIGVILLCLLLLARNRGHGFKQLGSFIIALISGYFLFRSFHIATLLSTELGKPKQILSGAFSKVVIFDNLLPGWRFLELSIRQDSVIWILFLVGIIVAIRDLILRKGQNRDDNLVIFAFLIPLLSLIFYRNAFPYYYVFIMAPATIFCGVVVHKITEHFTKPRRIFCVVLIVGLYSLVFINFLHYYVAFSSKRTIAQSELLEAVHKMFPEPVPYIDGCSMVSSFPTAGFFMSSWGMENYLGANKPIMKDILTQEKPLFLLADVPHLNLSLPWGKALSATNYSLSMEDWDILTSSFIQHWGIVYVPGKEFALKSKVKCQSFEILIPGTYTLEGEAVVSINGIAYEPGDTINLKKGSHIVSTQEDSGKAALRWGDHLYKPSNKPSSDPLFAGLFL